MSAPLTYHLSVYRGDSHRWQVVLWADAAKTQPADLTGVTATSEIHQGATVTPLDCTVTDNTIDVVLTASASQQLAIAVSRWDLQLTYPSGEVTTIVSGRVDMYADVTGSAVA